MRRVCFFHAGCPDGFGAAWAVRRAWGEGSQYVPRGHDDPFRPEDYEGDCVAFVDIALEPESLRALGAVAAEVTILDHHVSSRDRFLAEPGLAAVLRAQGHRVVFDLEHSGAVLAWEHFHPGTPVPEILRYVEDQDLWRWQLPRSEELNAALASYPRRFEAWDELAARPASTIADEGVPILRANRIEIDRLLKTSHPLALGTRRVEGVNSPVLRSLIGHELARRAAYGLPCGLVYRLCDDRVDVSLYSIGDFDVARIAAEHGGGGHRNAAGFTVKLRDWLERFV